jgi:hypothetical protein
MQEVKYTIVCVLKTGQWTHPGTKDKTVEYGPEHVIWLRDQVAKHYNGLHRFVCLSDIDIPGVETIKLKHNWPGWWSKMELFRPDLGFDRMFYIDLDTVLAGNIMPMVKYDHKFTVLRNLSRGKGIGSGMMAWRAAIAHRLYDWFCEEPERHMAEYVSSNRWGDQGFIEDRLRPSHLFQDIFPKQIVSYTIDMNKQGDPPPKARVVIFHGKLKPWEVEASWIPRP